jgi:two-component system, OmpR family, copper resistance phosphate regulon response regulator CusR
MTHILIAEDEQRIASFIDKGLSANGFAVTTVTDGRSAYEYVLTGDFDLMILDIGLPEMDGFEVLRRLRAQGHRVPVIVLTARSSVHDTVAALEGGADDYMAKPFRFEELLARVRLRLAPTVNAETADSVLSCGGLHLDLRTRRALVGGQTVDLSAREFALAETFLRHAGQVLTREQLLSQVWGYDYDPGSNVVDVYVRYLRRKLGADRFVTLRGMGYRLEALP